MLLVMILACMCSACSGDTQGEENKQGTDNKSNYLTNTFAPDLYDILFEKQPNEYEKPLENGYVHIEDISD